MAVRREAVLLELEDHFLAGILADAAAVEALSGSLDRLSNRAVNTSRSTQNLERDTDRLGQSSSKAGAEVDRLSGRMRILADIALILGPALSPIGAVGIAALSGLANQFGFTVAAAGTLILAFHGIGDALDKVNKAAIAPTETNIKNAQLAMSQLTPVAQQFVRSLQDLRPLMQSLQGTAQASLFPGLTAGLQNLVKIAPQVDSLLHVIGSTLGDIAEAAGTDLASGRWTDFFQMLAAEARPTLEAMAGTIGDLVHGMSELWEAFTPLNRDFSNWLRDAARGFDEWATGLSSTAEFQDFIDFVRQSGPHVGEALASIANAFVQVAEAIGPLGGVSLQIIQSLADAIAKLADSDLGTPLLATAAGLVAISRAMSLLKRTGITGAAAAESGGLLAGILGPDPTKSRVALQGMKADIQNIGAVWGTAGARTAREQARLSASYQSLTRNASAFAGQAVRVAGPLAGIAAQSGLLGDSLEQSNTAIFAMYGSALGPWGAALGAAAGAVSDVTARNDAMVHSLEAVDAAISAGNLPMMRQNLAAASQEIQKFADSYDKSFGQEMKDLFSPGSFITHDLGPQLKDGIEGLFGQTDLEEAVAQFNSLSAAVHDFQLAQSTVSKRVHGDLTAAMERLGITTKDVYAAFRSDKLMDAAFGQGTGTAVDDLVRRLNHAASVVDLLGTRSRTTASDIMAMNNAMQEATDTALGAANASLAYRNAVADVEQAIKDNGKHWRDNTDKARANEAALQGLAGAWNQQAQSVQNNVSKWATARKTFIESAVAMGASQKAAERMADSWMHIPEVKNLKVKLNDHEFVSSLKDARKAFDSLPEDVQTDIKANGIPQTKREVLDLAKKYDLTPKQVRTLATLNDQASPTIQGVMRLLDMLAKQKPKPHVELTGADAAIANANGVKNALAGIKDKSVTVTTTFVTKYTDGRSNNGTVLSDHWAGGWTGPGGKYQPAGTVHADEVVLPKEIVHRDAEMLKSRYGFLPGMDQLPGYADGGLVGGNTSISRFTRFGGSALDFALWERELNAAGSAIVDLATVAGQSAISLEDAEKREIKTRKEHLQELLKLQGDERDALRDRLDALRQERQAVMDAVANLIQSSADMFGTVRTPVIPGIGSTGEITWTDSPATFGSASSAQDTQFQNAQLLQQYIQQLKSKGFRGEALQYLLEHADLATIADFANQSKADLKAYMANFQGLQHLQHQVGGQAAGAVGLNQAIRDVAKSLHAAEQAYKETNRRLQNLEKHSEGTNRRLNEANDHLKKAPALTGGYVADALEHASGHAGRRARR